jgi:hypothetical protein
LDFLVSTGALGTRDKARLKEILREDADFFFSRIWAG